MMDMGKIDKSIKWEHEKNKKRMPIKSENDPQSHSTQSDEVQFGRLPVGTNHYTGVPYTVVPTQNVGSTPWNIFA